MRLSLVDRHHRRTRSGEPNGQETDEPGVGHLKVFPEANRVETRDLLAEPCRHDGSVRNHHSAVAQFGDRGIEPGRSIAEQLPSGHRPHARHYRSAIEAHRGSRPRSRSSRAHVEMAIRELDPGEGDQLVTLFAAVLPGFATALVNNVEEPEACSGKIERMEQHGGEAVRSADELTAMASWHPRCYRRAVAYVTDPSGRLLVFEHVDVDAGTQGTGGGIHEGSR